MSCYLVHAGITPAQQLRLRAGAHGIPHQQKTSKHCSPGCRPTCGCKRCKQPRKKPYATRHATRNWNKARRSRNAAAAVCSL